MARPFTLAALLVAISCSVASAADPWIGKSVFWKNEAKAKVGNREVNIELLPFPSIIEDVKGEWLWMGRAWVNKRDVLLPEQALDYYSAQIRMNPSSAIAWGYRGSVWQEKGELDNAIKDFTAAIRIDPTLAQTFNNRGIAWSNKAELDNAIKDFTEAFRLDPRFAMAYNNRGNAWNQKGELDKAIKDYTEAIRVDPKYAMAYYNRGLAWSDKGVIDKAIKDYTEAIRLDPQDAASYTNRGLALSSKGKLDRATKDYQEAIRLDPQNATVAYNASAWLWATCSDERYRDGAKAVANATKACEFSAWKDGEYIDTLAAAYAESGDFANAIKWAEKAIELATAESDKDEMQERLELYKADSPYRDKPNK